jgi:hypothetical protein
VPHDKRIGSNISWKSSNNVWGVHCIKVCRISVEELFHESTIAGCDCVSTANGKDNRSDSSREQGSADLLSLTIKRSEGE